MNTVIAIPVENEDNLRTLYVAPSEVVVVLNEEPEKLSSTRERFELSEERRDGHGNIIDSSRDNSPSVYCSVLIVLSGLLTTSFCLASIFLFIFLVLVDSNWNLKPFKAACFTFEDMADNVCFFSAGAYAQGLITVGAASVGLVSLGQGTVGLLFGVGQGVIGVGWVVGQFASGWYVYAAQLGIGFYRVRCAQLAIQFLYSYNPYFLQGVKSCFFPLRSLHSRNHVAISEVLKEDPFRCGAGCE